MKLRRFASMALLLATTALIAMPARAETEFSFNSAAPGILDPSVANDYSGAILAFNLYDGLVVPGQGGEQVAPQLAKSWKIEGSDYTFALRDDVKFHSGNPLTADDVVFSFKRLMTIGKGNSPLFADRVKDVVAADPHTVKFTLNGTYAPFLEALVRFFVLDSKTVMAHKADGQYGDMGDYGQAWLADHDAGSGAYMAVTHVPESESNLVKFPGYFLGAPANAPDKVRIRFGLPAPTVRELVASGQQTMTSQWIPPEVKRALLNRTDTHPLVDGGSDVLFTEFNTRKPPLDDVNCRLALTYAYDYTNNIKIELVSDNIKSATPTNGALAHGELGYNAKLPIYAQDMAKAKDYLAKCRYKTPDERKIEIAWITEVPAEEKHALLTKANFDALGFQTSLKGTPWTLYTHIVSNVDTTPDVSMIYVESITPDPDSKLYNMYHSKAPLTFWNPSHLNDPEVDKLLDAERTETDTAKRKEIFDKLNSQIVADAPAIFTGEVGYVFVGLDNFHLPPLEDPSKQFSIAQYGLQFRMIEMAK
jgi:peptide/nickel transport system substrate-binding protein